MDSLLRKLAPTADVDGEVVSPQPVPQLAMLDFFFPGFSSISSVISKYLGIDLNVYIPLALLFGGLTFLWRYFSEYLWDLTQRYLMSTVEVRSGPNLLVHVSAGANSLSSAGRSAPTMKYTTSL